MPEYESRGGEADNLLFEELREAFDAEQVVREELMIAMGDHDLERLAELEQAYKDARAASDRILGLRLDEEHREAA